VRIDYTNYIYYFFIYVLLTEVQHYATNHKKRDYSQLQHYPIYPLFRVSIFTDYKFPK